MSDMETVSSTKKGKYRINNTNKVVPTGDAEERENEITRELEQLDGALMGRN